MLNSFLSQMLPSADAENDDLSEATLYEEIHRASIEEREEARRLGMTPEEFNEYLGDLCEDAGSIGTLGPF